MLPRSPPANHESRLRRNRPNSPNRPCKPNSKPNANRNQALSLHNEQQHEPRHEDQSLQTPSVWPVW